MHNNIYGDKFLRSLKGGGWGGGEVKNIKIKKNQTVHVHVTFYATFLQQLANFWSIAISQGHKEGKWVTKEYLVNLVILVNWRTNTKLYLAVFLCQTLLPKHSDQIKLMKNQRISSQNLFIFESQSKDFSES